MGSNIIKSEDGSKETKSKEEVDTIMGGTESPASTSRNAATHDTSPARTQENTNDETRSKHEEAQLKTEEAKSEEALYEPSDDEANFDEKKGQPKPRSWEKDDGKRGDEYHPPGSWYLGNGVWIEPDHPLY